MSIWPSRPALLIRLSSLVLLHAAYSAWEGQSPAAQLPLTRTARTMVKAAGGAPVVTSWQVVIPFDVGPLLPAGQAHAVPQIALQAVLAFLALVVGVCWSAAPLSEITWAHEMRSRYVSSTALRLLQGPN